MKTDYDVIMVGGGMGGAALARVLAKKGKRVLVVEREAQFKDRVRGEFLQPWGAAEAQKLGLYQALLERCANQQPIFNVLGMGPPRDLRTTTPQRLPALTFYHPEMQEVVLEEAARAGAEVWRGASVREVRLDARPSANIERDGLVHRLSARLVVAADGRSSTARSWGDFATQRATTKLLGAGMMFENLRADPAVAVSLVNPSLHRNAFLFPQGKGRVRAYLMYPPEEIDRLQGDGDFARFIAECLKTGMPANTYTGARATGPLASFDMTEHWVDHPFRDGLALVGDAAGASDPTWGQGLSQALRDARILSELLLADDDWDRAGHAYANARDQYFSAIIKVSEWGFDLFFAAGSEADNRRSRALPLLMQEPDRFPDHFFCGPDLPADERVRQRLFGEI